MINMKILFLKESKKKQKRKMKNLIFKNLIKFLEMLLKFFMLLWAYLELEMRMVILKTFLKIEDLKLKKKKERKRKLNELIILLFKFNELS